MSTSHKPLAVSSWQEQWLCSQTDIPGFWGFQSPGVEHGRSSQGQVDPSSLLLEAACLHGACDGLLIAGQVGRPGLGVMAVSVSAVRPAHVLGNEAGHVVTGHTWRRQRLSSSELWSLSSRRLQGSDHSTSNGAGRVHLVQFEILSAGQSHKGHCKKNYLQQLSGEPPGMTNVHICHAERSSYLWLLSSVWWVTEEPASVPSNLSKRKVITTQPEVPTVGCTCLENTKSILRISLRKRAKAQLQTGLI